MTEHCRLDVWLYAARFFKTRQLAVNAVRNGRIRVNHVRAKPSRSVQIGDCIFIQKQSDLEFEVIVRELANKRVSAAIAQTFYEETPDSIAKREHLRTQKTLAKNLVDFPAHRPDKRARRQIRAFRHNMEDT